MDAQARHLLDLKKEAGGSWEGALRGYNTGRTAASKAGDAYVSAVSARADHEHSIIQDWQGGQAWQRNAAVHTHNEEVLAQERTNYLNAAMGSMPTVAPPKWKNTNITCAKLG
jgi:hypothetical protein